MILIIDNYDSFVFNLSRYITQLGSETVVVRNDAITVEDIEYLHPSHIVISPGPCGPEDAGISLDIIRTFQGKIPILGICLGHQAIGYALGGKVTRAQRPMHGRASLIHHDNRGLFRDIPNPLHVARYHSLIVSDDGLPSDVDIHARSEEGEIMALSHSTLQLFGVQFHPESILTEYGYRIIENFIQT